jgi:uncharacterized membrane protein YkvI
MMPPTSSPLDPTTNSIMSDGRSRFWRVYAVPAGVFQSLMIGGGYGTGREIVEYFSRFGFVGGLLGLTLVAGCFAVLLAISYEFARCYRAYDYRRFIREILGHGWIAFEVVYLAMLALVLAVTAAASGRLVEDYLHLPAAVGVAALLLLVILFAFYGREWVTRVLAYKALFLCLVFVVYFLIVVFRTRERIAGQFSNHEIITGWVLAATRYFLYASVVVPTMLFATTAIETRQQAVTSGITSALMGVIPAALLHISFGAGYPEVLTRSIPLFWMVTGLKVPALTVAYLIVLFGSLFDVGIGFVQSVNERVDGWSMERRGRRIRPRTRASVALLCLLVSGGLSSIGIVRLIAVGYGTMAYGFLLLFVGPLFTVGIYRLVTTPYARTGRRLRWRAAVKWICGEVHAGEER